MTVKISWLPNGHVVHGYRKVFAVHDSTDSLYRVVVFAPMGYETVYQVKESAAARPDYQDIEIDPALLWGLSLLVQQLTGKEELFTDDGYEKQRPLVLEADELLDASIFQEAVAQGFMVLGSND